MKKNNPLPKLFISLVTISLLGCISGITYAWFSRQNNVNLDSIYQGTSAGAYFAYGSGTQDDPYGISEPRHLYNLAWLQYLGQFNEDKDEDGKIDSQYYFELANDIDMQGLVLPPIGTEDNPFIGNFDGKEFTVSNLTISNSIGSDNITNYPYTVTDDFNNNKPEVIGFFGVVGYLPADESKYSLESVTVGSGTDTTEEPINQVHDLYLNNITVKNTSSQLLAGFLAGYVNGSMTNCGVHYCDFDIASGTTNIEDLSTSVSKYSYVGAINTDKYKIDGDTSGGGQDNDFGGSIDMLAINRRLDYITSSIQNESVTNDTNTYGDSTKWNNFSIYNVAITTNKSGSSSETYWNDSNSSSNLYYYLWRGTYLPLNIDEVASGLKDDDGNLNLQETEVNSWHITDLYKKGNKEIISSTNTGYIVGGNPNVRTAIMPIAGYKAYSSTYAGIYKSMGLSSANDSNRKTFDSYEETQPIQLLTIKNKTTYRIIDSNNKNYNYPELSSITNNTDESKNFSKYSQVMSNFRKSMKNSKTIHGFHFLQAIDMASLTTSKHQANLCGVEYENYEFVNSSLNFTVKKNGYITTLLGGYYRVGYDNTSFDLYQVWRNESGTIENIKKVSQIYDKSGEIVYKYFDKNNNISFSDTSINSTSNMTLLIDLDYITNKNNLCIKEGTAYYFEFPALSGDYIIGASKTSGGSDGSGGTSYTENPYMAYLMYLDIGANASSESGEDEKDTLTIDFVWATSDSSSVIALIKISDEAYVKSEVVLEITSYTSTTAKRSYFYYKRIAPVSSGTSTTFSYVYYYGDYGGLKIENIGTDGNALVQPSKDAVKNG